jgi:uncharacterized Fe-S radical SAM superfamily protein PflX
VNIMAQYRPSTWRTSVELSRRLTRTEYQQALSWARAVSLTHITGE